MRHFYAACGEAIQSKKEGISRARGYVQPGEVILPDAGTDPGTKGAGQKGLFTASGLRGMRLKIAPFAPDQSGAAAVFCELGGLSVIIDAGGCAGNVCGFDEPRWFSSKSAIFSAGLRDMDAILGRDDALVAKVSDASARIESSFTVLIGTPVPAVIGTDYAALKRMLEKKTGKPAMYVESDGTRLYDWGASEGFLTLMKTFAGRGEDGTQEAPAELSVRSEAVGILGATPMDVGDIPFSQRIRPWLESKGIRKAYCYTMGAGLNKVRKAASVKKNIVIAPAGLSAARYLQERYGIPYETDYPLELIEGLDQMLAAAGSAAAPEEEAGRKEPMRILLVHQQMLANALRDRILKEQPDAQIVCASWFMMDRALMREGDFALSEEDQWQEMVYGNAYDLIIGDPLFAMAIPDYKGDWTDLYHFAVSGKRTGL